MTLVDGEQASYQNTSDHEPIKVGTRGGLPGRFFFITGMLPLASTQGRDEVEIMVRTFTSGPAGGNIDNVDVTFGLRGSSGTFRVDDLRVEPVE